MMSWMEQLVRMWVKEKLLQTMNRRDPIKRIRCTWLNYIKTDVKLIWWKDMDLFELAQDTVECYALVNTVRDIRVP
jgi:hypothetical protein